MNFGDILKKLRQDKKMTQEELAIKINSSRSNIANYENNNNMPSVEILDRLAKIFDVSTDYMLGKTNIKNNKLDLTDEDIKFIKSIKKLDNTNKMKINIKKRVKARTTGKLKRKMKKAVNPLYGKKGMGYIKNPKRAIQNKIYHKTTFDPLKFLKDLFK